LSRCRKGHGEYTGNECPICKRGRRHGLEEKTIDQWITKWYTFSQNTKWCILYVKGFAKYIKHFPEVIVIRDACIMDQGNCTTDGLILKIKDKEFFDLIDHESAYQEPIRSRKHTIKSNEILGEGAP
jgi:hypothetical protein